MRLSLIELKSLIKVHKKSENTLYGICPKCGKNEFGISILNNHPFGCFRKKKCGFSGNIFTLLKYLGIKGNLNDNQYKGFSIDEKLEEESGIKFEILPEIKMPAGFRNVLKSSNLEIFTYLLNRGYNEDDFINYDVGHTIVDKYQKNRVIIGFKENEKVVAYIGRSLKEETVPKYLNSETDFEKLIDGLYENNYSEATLVEGHFDRINVRNKFKELGIKSRVLCMFSSKITDYQIALMQREGITDINIFFDPDVLKTIKKSSSKIGNKFRSVNVMMLNDKDKDPGDANKNDIYNSYKNRQNFVKFALTGLPDLVD